MSAIYEAGLAHGARRVETELARIVACLERIPCQQTMTVEDCDVAVAAHVLHPDRYEKLPRSEWCGRCDALAAARALLAEDGADCVCGETSTRNCPVHAEDGAAQQRLARDVGRWTDEAQRGGAA